MSSQQQLLRDLMIQSAQKRQEVASVFARRAELRNNKAQLEAGVRELQEQIEIEEGAIYAAQAALGEGKEAKGVLTGTTVDARKKQFESHLRALAQTEESYRNLLNQVARLESSARECSAELERAEAVCAAIRESCNLLVAEIEAQTELARMEAKLQSKIT